MPKYKNTDKEIIKRIEKLKTEHTKIRSFYTRRRVDIMSAEEKSSSREGYINKRFILNEKNYSFLNFDEFHFFASDTLEKGVLEGSNFELCTFENCIFENITFKDCRFYANTFRNVRFMNVIFEDCSFSELRLIEDENSSDWICCGNIFTSCGFWGSFVNLQFNDSLTRKDMENCLFDRSMFYSVSIEKCSLKSSVFDGCITYDMRMKDCDLRGFAVKDIDRLDISFADDRGTYVDENTLINWDVKAKRRDFAKNTGSEEQFSHYDDICTTKARTLLRIARLFGKNGLSNYEGEYFFRAKLLEQKGLHSVSKVKSFVSLTLCGYGERPSFTFLTILCMILLFGIIYMFAGVQTGEGLNDIIQYPIHTGSSLISDLGKCLFFSITNFSTVGYGNYVPVGTVSSVFSAVQMLMGVGLCALWTGCIFRKMSR